MKTTSRMKDLIWNKGLTNTGKFLVARMFYVDGMVIITTGIGIFGTSVIGLSMKEILFTAIIANIAGALGCYMYGFFFKNNKKIIMNNLLILIIIVAGISISNTQLQFMILAIAGTFFSGPLQSSSRAIMANLTPDNIQGISFGIFTVSGKITAFIGPILAGVMTFVFSQRVGFGFSIVLLLLGFFLMAKVNYKNN
jgi:UMF1 family MFS transporter